MTKPAVLAPIAEILHAYWKADRWTLLSVAGAVVLASVAGIAAPYLFSRLVDQLSQPGAAAGLTLGFLLYALLLGISSALQRVIQYLSFMSAENLGFIMSTRFFERLLGKSTSFFIAHNPAEIQNAGTLGRSALTTFVQLGLIVLIPGIAQIALTLATLGAMINAEVVAIVAVYGLGFVALTMLANRRTRSFLDAAVAAGQENARFVGNAMSAMETLRHFGSHGWMSGRFAGKAREVRDNWRNYVLRRVAFIVLFGLGLAAQAAVTFLLLLPRHEAGEISVGDVVLFNMLLLQLNMPFEMIGQAIDDMVRSRANLMPLARIWAAPEESRPSHASNFAPKAGRILFEEVGFSYGNGRGLDGVGFMAERGGITFLVGETGSGKSTVFKLALKSIEPSSGRITIDGTDLAGIDRADWHGAVAVVPQDIVLLNESLADNILLGRPRDEARLREAMEKAAILSFIEALPEGFDTVVGERGLKLSGGERQRIAIARALYGDPAILFLDEASSALDETTERDIMDHIRSLSREVTVLAITHRRSVIADGDAVVALEGGRRQPC